MCAAVLSLEAITIALATPVMVAVSGLDVATAVWLGVGLAVACVALAGMLRSEGAYYVGWVLQLAAIAMGFVVPMMFVLGLIFAALWVMAYFLGVKIERERAAYSEASAEPR